jgi:tetratricopeptide (TPR) repeat protein
VGVRLRIHLPESHQDNLQALRLRELPLAQAGSGSSELAFLVNGPLPQNVTFLSLFIIGQLRYQANEYQAGYAAFDAAMANLPATVIFENEALLHFFRARQLERSGEENAVEVICDYARAIVLDPDFAPAYNNLGVFLAVRQLPPKVDEAVEDCLAALPFGYPSPSTLFYRAAELQPNSALAAYNRLAWDYSLGHISLPTEMVDEMIARDPSIPGPYILSGILAVQENDLTKAESRFQAIIGQLPELRLNLSLVYLLQERPQAAQPLLEQLLAENPADAEALLALTYLVYQEEGYEPAQRYLEQIPPLAQVYPVTTTGTEEIEPVAKGFDPAGYVTSPLYMADLLRVYFLFTTGDVAGAIKELEQLILTTERIFRAGGYPDHLPLERYLLSLLYTLAGDEAAAQAGWETIGPLNSLYGVTAQAATAKAWESLEANCNEEALYWSSSPDWLTPDNSCLPLPLPERITAVFDLFVNRLPGRITHEVAGFLGGQACPFVFTYNVERQRWVRDNVILYELVGLENERSQWRQLDHFDGRLLIRELEPEISYLDEVYVVVIDATGRQTILRHDFTPLQAADGRRWVMRQGDQLLLTFPDYESLTAGMQFWVVATGYYLPLPVEVE